MSAYREGPAPAGLPFPRPRLRLFTALTLVLSIAVLILPLGRVGSHAGWQMVREGGVGMFLLLFLSLFAATTIAVLGAFAVRGKRAPAVVLPIMPALGALAGAFFFWNGTRLTMGAVAGGAVAPEVVMRILAEGLAESDACLVLGTFLASLASLAVASALLGSAASVDPDLARADTSNTSRLPLVLGVAAAVLGVALRVAFRTLFGSLLGVLPIIAVSAALATLAARSATVVRDWHDAQEARRWTGALLGGAIVAATAVALFDAYARFGAERDGLSATAHEGLDAAQRARILAEVAREVHAATIFTVVDGVLVLAIVASALAPVFGRSATSGARAPALGAPIVSVASAILVTAALAAPHAKAMGEMHAASVVVTAQAPKVELPVVESTARFPSWRQGGPVLRVTADGNAKQVSVIAGDEKLVVLEADKHARWSAVERQLASALAFHPDNHLPLVCLRVRIGDPPRTEGLGDYADFVAGAETSCLAFGLGMFQFHGILVGPLHSIDPPRLQDVEGLVAQMLVIVARDPPSPEPRLLLERSHGERW